MIVQVFGISSCQTTRKAQRFFKERRVEFQFRDLALKGLAPRELDDLLKHQDLDDLVDKESRAYTERGLAYLVSDLRTEILDNPLILKRPLIRSGAGWSVGDRPEDWKKHL